ncbi:GGDEF domain-containing protein [Vibrio sinensis]|uniref:diguanylate cyclase n=1 Tax=Vibrio sinensis TaxID=2302434 RepID=A0A3A6QPX7_9VIBR|nr:GGDEF domain-containing protein [Vibrio sinensis]RJX70458.1 GGDEF domain-containing protein [Vibrio sinensis]
MSDYRHNFDSSIAQLFDEQSRDSLLKLMMAITLVTFVPFGIKNFVIGEPLLGASLLIFELSFITELSGLFYLRRSLIGYRIPLMLLVISLTLNVWGLGIMSTFWVFPIVIALALIIPFKDAILANGTIVMSCASISLLHMDWDVAMRFILAMIFCTAIAHLAVYKIAQLQERLRELSIRDAMTGALNRSQLDILLERAIDNQGVSSTIAIIDIDHFKQVNDLYGHDIGDEVINQLVALIERNTRKLDRLFRLGGDEFLILFEGTDATSAYRILNHITRKAQMLNCPPNAKVTLSIGVAECQASDKPELWMKRADNALYCAKHNGRDQISCAERAWGLNGVEEWTS